MLDTNQAELLDVSPNPLFVMVRHVAAAHGHELAIPEMVLTEMLAHWRYRVETQLRLVERASAELGNLRASLMPIRLPDVDKLADQREAVLREQYMVLPTPEGAAVEALGREANRRRPADIDWEKKGAGARDVVVWLTLLAATEQHARDLVFVSDDGDFFDRRGALHPELSAEVSARSADGYPLQCVRKIDDLLALLATQVPVPPTFDLLESSRHMIKDVVGKSAQGGTLAALRSVASLLGDRLESSLEVSQLIAEPRSKVYAYEVSGKIWICARARWTGCVDIGFSVDGSGLDAPPTSVPFEIDGSLLVDGPDVPPGFAQLLSHTSTRFVAPNAHVRTMLQAAAASDAATAIAWLARSTVE